MPIIMTSITPSMDEALVNWMKSIYESMDNKEWLAFDDEDELLKIIERGRAYSCIAFDESHEKIAAIFLVNFYDINDQSFYGHYCLSIEELRKSAVMDIAMVDPLYRGQGLQKRTMEYVEKKLADAGYEYLLATVSPDNVYSYNNLISAGYRVQARKLLYGGLDRFIMLKKLISINDYF